MDSRVSLAKRESVISRMMVEHADACPESTKTFLLTMALIHKLSDHYETEFWEPHIVIQQGSGFTASVLINALKNRLIVDYDDLPFMGVTHVKGHSGKFVFGELVLDGGARIYNVAILCGRHHLYNGKSPDEIVRPLRVMAFLGGKVFMITNGVGSVHEQFAPGMVWGVRDYLNFSGQNPFKGEPQQFEWLDGDRFTAMANSFSTEMREDPVEKAVVALGLSKLFRMGVYCSTNDDPNYETGAMAKAFRTLGADFMGMGLASEVAALRQMQLSGLPEEFKPKHITAFAFAMNWCAECGPVTQESEEVQEVETVQQDEPSVEEPEELKHSELLDGLVEESQAASEFLLEVVRKIPPSFFA